jgi:hypothetical protein
MNMNRQITLSISAAVPVVITRQKSRNYSAISYDPAPYICYAASALFS